MSKGRIITGKPLELIKKTGDTITYAKVKTKKGIAEIFVLDYLGNLNESKHQSYLGILLEKGTIDEIKANGCYEKYEHNHSKGLETVKVKNSEGFNIKVDTDKNKEDDFLLDIDEDDDDDYDYDDDEYEYEDGYSWWDYIEDDYDDDYEYDYDDEKAKNNLTEKISSWIGSWID